MAEKKVIYTQLRILGAAMFIPLFLAVGPISGFYLGVFLVRKYSLHISALFICVTLGLVAGTLETIKIIKFIMREEKK